MEREHQNRIFAEYEDAAGQLERAFRREAMEFWSLYHAAHPLPKQKNPPPKDGPSDEVKSPSDEETLLVYARETFITAYALGQWEWLHTRRRVEILTKQHILPPFPVATTLWPENPPPIPLEFCHDGEKPSQPPKTKR